VDDEACIWQNSSYSSFPGQICVGQAWATFDQLAKDEPQSSFYLFTHLTVPAGKPLHSNRQLIHNCIVLKVSKA
jgi:hypothetical protein